MKRVLLVSFHDPLCTNYGAGQRTNLLARGLARAASLDVVLFDASTKDFNTTRLPPDLGAGFIYRIPYKSRSPLGNTKTLLRSPALTSSLKDHIDITQYDSVVCRYITPATKIDLSGAKHLVIDFDDPIYRQNPGQRAPLLHTIVNPINKFITDRYVNKRHNRQHHYLFVSQQDADHFDLPNSSILPNIPLIDNSINMETHSTEAAVILFVGFLGWQPNAEGITHFVRHVWPLIHQQHPHAILRIVGKCPDLLRQQLNDVSGCHVMGFVSDLRAEYEKATFCVVPLLSGGGSNIKLPEAYAYKRAVVASRYSYTAWSDLLVEDEDIMVADSPADMAARCLHLLRNERELQRITRNGSEKIATHLSFDAFASRLDDVLNRRSA